MVKGKTYTIKIGDTRWKYRLLSADVFERLHGTTTDAITITENGKHYVEFHKDALSLIVVRHELLHMYVHALCLASATVSSSAMEEILAELVSRNWDRMNLHANQMFAKLSNSKDNLNE